jgi:hypothetical protein
VQGPVVQGEHQQRHQDGSYFQLAGPPRRLGHQGLQAFGHARGVDDLGAKFDGLLGDI